MLRHHGTISCLATWRRKLQAQAPSKRFRKSGDRKAVSKRSPEWKFLKTLFSCLKSELFESGDSIVTRAG